MISILENCGILFLLTLFAGILREFSYSFKIPLLIYSFIHSLKDSFTLTVSLSIKTRSNSNMSPDGLLGFEFLFKHINSGIKLITTSITRNFHIFMS